MSLPHLGSKHFDSSHSNFQTTAPVVWRSGELYACENLHVASRPELQPSPSDGRACTETSQIGGRAHALRSHSRRDPRRVPLRQEEPTTGQTECARSGKYYLLKHGRDSQTKQLVAFLSACYVNLQFEDYLLQMFFLLCGETPRASRSFRYCDLG